MTRACSRRANVTISWRSTLRGSGTLFADAAHIEVWMMLRMRNVVLSSWLILCWMAVVGEASPDQEVAPPFELTEDRDRCDHYEPLKQPFFGELHLHTSYSMDAVSIDTRVTPADAYRYAAGQRVGLPPWQDTRIPDAEAPEPASKPSAVSGHPYCLPGERCQYTATRTAQKGPGRGLDFAAITDHAEQFGEANICFFEPTERCDAETPCSLAGQSCNNPLPTVAGMCVPDGYDSSVCQLAREELSRLRLGSVPGLFGLLNDGVRNPARLSQICRPNNPRAPALVRRGPACELNAKRVWDQIGADAEAAYDRTSSCRFTSFHAYEYTAMANNGRCSLPRKTPRPTSLPCWSDDDCPGRQMCNTPYAQDVLGGLDNLHRNIIFRNATTVELPISNVEQPTGCGEGRRCLPRNRGPVASPVRMLRKLARACSNSSGDVDDDCEFLSIPHNSNMSGGSMFVPETLNRQEARIRNRYEPLVEIVQIKGQSECRYSEETGIWWGIGSDEADPLCDFENLSFTRLNGNYLAGDQANRTTIPPRSYVRNVLQSGIEFQARKGGANPFKLGFVGALDNHNGLPGQTNESVYAKVGGHGVNSFAVSGQALDETNFLGLETNAGGLTVAWAEENSRDAIFHALKNRETYATSGTRPIVRFFGGFGLPDDICGGGNFARKGYAHGVAMGGTLRVGRRHDAEDAPRFAVSALWDPGWAGRPGTRLQRAQIIKGWVDDEGQTHEKVIDASQFQHGNAGDAATYLPDASSCTPASQGYSQLCAVWTDPDFDPDERAFYYARVLEQPSCRWSKHYCDARNIACEQPMGTCRAASSGDGADGQGCSTLTDCPEGSVCELPGSYSAWEYQQCCGDIVPDVVQQRAWTSPIWIDP